MILDDASPMAIVLDADGAETGSIVPWMTGNATHLAYQCDGYVLQVNGDDEPLADFRRLPGRVWASPAGQEVRVFQTDPGVWQYSVAGMDISDGEVSTTEAGAAESARGVTVAWSEDGDYPLWANLFRPAHSAAYDSALATWRDTCHHPEGTLSSLPPLEQGCAGCTAYFEACEAFYAALRDEDDQDAGMADEALCTGCGQSFVPSNGPEDLIHMITTVPAGQKWGPATPADAPEGPERYCGGRGDLLGGY